MSYVSSNKPQWQGGPDERDSRPLLFFQRGGNQGLGAFFVFFRWGEVHSIRVGGDPYTPGGGHHLMRGSRLAPGGVGIDWPATPAEWILTLTVRVRFAIGSSLALPHRSTHATIPRNHGTIQDSHCSIGGNESFKIPSYLPPRQCDTQRTFYFPNGIGNLNPNPDSPLDPQP